MAELAVTEKTLMLCVVQMPETIRNLGHSVAAQRPGEKDHTEGWNTKEVHAVAEMSCHRTVLVAAGSTVLAAG